MNTSTPICRRPLVLALFLGSLAGLLTSSCSDSEREVVALPSTDDLYAYSVAVAERARSLLPEDRAQALHNIGRVHHRFGRDESAIPFYQEATRLDSAFADAHLAMAQFFAETDRAEEAIHAYQAVLRSSVEPARGVWTQIGLVLVHMGRVDEAIEALETEVRQGTDSVGTHSHLGLAYKSNGDWKNAAAAFRRALELDENFRDAIHGLAEALRLSGKPEEAKVYLERLKEIKKREDAVEVAHRADEDDAAKQRGFASDTWYDAAVLLLQERLRVVQGTRDAGEIARLRREGLSALERALEFDPSSRVAHGLRVQIVREEKNEARTIEMLGEALAASPGDPVLSVQLAEIRLERALRFNAEDRSGAPARTAQSRRVVDELGAARAALEAVVAKHPEAGKACGLLAELYIRHYSGERGLGSKAVRLAAMALSQASPPQAAPYDVLAGAHMVNGEPRKALETLREGLKKVPKEEHALLERRIAMVERVLSSGADR